MKRVIITVLNFIAGIAGILALFIPFHTVCLGGHASAQSNADWDWVNEHFGKALHDLLPIDEGLVAYRSHRDLYTDVIEYSFTIGHDKSSSGYGLEPYLTAHVRQADSASLYDQMMALHRKFPNRSPEDVRKDLRVKKWDLAEKRCPAVKTQFLKFQQLRLAPPQFDVIILHPLIHEFHIQGGSGDMKIALYDEKNSFVPWAVETQRELELCSQNFH